MSTTEITRCRMSTASEFCTFCDQPATHTVQRVDYIPTQPACAECVSAMAETRTIYYAEPIDAEGTGGNA
jgi:hypothetical protein